uniref:Uncharacterized protein n=1 Tax=Bartonella schoenbuchensis (strain DSM 13525 / NCTC 13165 / R1) TaxID=687861 RepID=E6Z1N8_BARSR|nr:hypothetical protein BARSC_190299 [Bartonella schoenbuchensis R1]
MQNARTPFQILKLIKHTKIMSTQLFHSTITTINLNPIVS